MLNNLRITQRYVIVLCAFWLSLVAIIGVSFWGLSSARDSLKTVHTEAMHWALLAEENIQIQSHDPDLRSRPRARSRRL